MPRIIIDYDELSIGADEALLRVRTVINGGRVSETSNGVLHYCWCTVFGDGIAVWTRRKKKHQKSDSFRVEHK